MQLAQTETRLGSEIIKGIGPLGDFSESPLLVFSQVISIIVGIMTIIAGIWFLFLLITGAIAIMGSGGDKAAAENARKRIMSGLIGLVVVIAAVFIVDLIGSLLGLNILNPGGTILNFLPF